MALAFIYFTSSGMVACQIFQSQIAYLNLMGLISVIVGIVLKEGRVISNQKIHGQGNERKRRKKMPNGREHLKYEDFGSHKYADHDGTSDCAYNCGCWAGPANSGGPTGVDPLGGNCPGNPLSKILGFGNKELTEKEMLDDFINARIEHLELKIDRLRPLAQLVRDARKNSKIKLQEEVIWLKRELVRLNHNMGVMKEIANKANREISSV